MRRSHRSRPEGHPLDATISRSPRDLGAVRRSESRVVRRLGGGARAGHAMWPATAARPAAHPDRRRRGERRREGRGAGDRHGCRGGLDLRHGPAAPRRDDPTVRRDARPVDLGHVLAPVHLRPRPPTRRRRRPAAGWAGPGDTDPARRRSGGVRGHRRHRAPDLRLRQAGRRSRLHRRQRPQRPARGRLDTVVGAGDRRRPTTARLDKLGARRGQPAHRSAGHRPTSRSCHSPPRPVVGAGGLGVLRLRHRRCLPPRRGPILDHRPDDPHDDPRDRHHRRNILDPDPLPQRPVGRPRSSGGSPMPRSPKSSSPRSPDAATPSTSPPD